MRQSHICKSLFFFFSLVFFFSFCNAQQSNKDDLGHRLVYRVNNIDTFLLRNIKDYYSENEKYIVKDSLIKILRVTFKEEGNQVFVVIDYINNKSSFRRNPPVNYSIIDEKIHVIYYSSFDKYVKSSRSMHEAYVVLGTKLHNDTSYYGDPALPKGYKRIILPGLDHPVLWRINLSRRTINKDYRKVE